MYDFSFFSFCVVLLALVAVSMAARARQKYPTRAGNGPLLAPVCSIPNLAHHPALARNLALLHGNHIYRTGSPGFKAASQ